MRHELKVIYIASPYSVGDVARNVHIQMEAAHRIMDMGCCPITPLLSHFLHIYRQRHYEDWTRCDNELVLRADIVLRLPGESPGADKECALARNAGIPVAFGWGELEGLMNHLYQLRSQCFYAQPKICETSTRRPFHRTTNTRDYASHKPK